MFDKDLTQEDTIDQVGINTKIKQSFATEEEMKAFLKNGGKIDYLEISEKKPKEIITESILFGDDKLPQPKIRRKLELNIEPVESTDLHEKMVEPKPQESELTHDIALNIFAMHSERFLAGLYQGATYRNQLEKPVEVKAQTVTHSSFEAKVEKSQPSLTLESLIKAKKRQKGSSSSTQFSKDEYARRALNSKNRAAAISENESEHIGFCLTHGETTFKIFINKKRQYRSRCSICRSTKYTEDGKITPCLKNTQRLQEIKQKRREAIKKGEKTFLATCKYHGLTIFVIAHKNSRCKSCKDEHRKTATQIC